MVDGAKFSDVEIFVDEFGEITAVVPEVLDFEGRPVVIESVGADDEFAPRE